MIKSLTVTGVNFVPVNTAYAKSFDTENMTNIIANGQAASIPAVTGNVEFMYLDDDGVSRHYIVSNTLADVNGAVSGFYGAAATGSTAQEFGDNYHRTLITITSFTQAIASANLAFGKKIYDFPEGYIKIDYCIPKITVSAPASVITPEVGIGTLLASGVQTDLGVVGATTENVIDGTAMSAITPAGTLFTAGPAVEADCNSLLDGHTTPIDLFLNLAGAWVTTENLTISGTVEIFWRHIGDL